MSGTSVDAIDVAITRITSNDDSVNVELVAYQEFPWTSEEREAILSVSSQPTTAQRLTLVDRMIGERFSSALRDLANQAHAIPDAIGFHGQTVAHIPDAQNGWFPSTLQLGNPYVCAQLFLCPVVFDFRRGDIVAGGQGAPLVPAADSILFHKHVKSGPIVIQNIGGIGNVTYLSNDASPIGFDTGPGNMVLDQIMRIRSGHHFDANGRCAASGTVNQALLSKCQRLFVPSSPPVSYGREQLGDTFVNQILEIAGDMQTNDLMATVSEWTASTIATGLRHLPSMPRQIYVAGGGAHNGDLLRRITSISGIEIRKLDDIGISADSREAVAFAILADARLRDVKLNLRCVTGSQVEQGLGAIALP
jgi:anhydro-N-acetylmuramic acid kinase